MPSSRSISRSISEEESSKGPKAVKTWEKTKVQFLVRHKSGQYYARLYLSGKEIWKPLKTAHFSVAKAKLPDAIQEIQRLRERRVEPSNLKMTFGQAATLHLERVAQNPNLKSETRKYTREVHTALLRSWPELEATEVRKITPAACREWAGRYALAMSATRYNGTLSFFRHVLGVAIESGVVSTNAASAVSRCRVKRKPPELPSRAEFVAFVLEMRNGHSRDSRNCADLVEGLAYTGCRISEARELFWANLDFENDRIQIEGDPDEGTKNGEVRVIPMIPSARSLLVRMRQSRSEEPQAEKVFLVRECQKSMDRAATVVAMKRITHHSLRHLFATICIECSVDIPTVSRWLGHKDGGKLCMQTYGHLRDEHSALAAQKVAFPVISTPLPNA